MSGDKSVCPSKIPHNQMMLTGQREEMDDEMTSGRCNVDSFGLPSPHSRAISTNSPTTLERRLKLAGVVFNEDTVVLRLSTTEAVRLRRMEKVDFSLPQERPGRSRTNTSRMKKGATTNLELLREEEMLTRWNAFLQQEALNIEDNIQTPDYERLQEDMHRFYLPKQEINDEEPAGEAKDEVVDDRIEDFQPHPTDNEIPIVDLSSGEMVIKEEDLDEMLNDQMDDLGYIDDEMEFKEEEILNNNNDDMGSMREAMEMEAEEMRDNDTDDLSLYKDALDFTEEEWLNDDASPIENVDAIAPGPYWLNGISDSGPALLAWVGHLFPPSEANENTDDFGSRSID